MNSRSETGLSAVLIRQWEPMPNSSETKELHDCKDSRKCLHGRCGILPLGRINALSFVRMGDFSEGDEVLVNGTGRVIGTFAVQLLMNIGVEVTAVDS